MKKMAEESKYVDRNLANFLLSYRNVPHSVTNQAPAVMMYNKTLRSSLHPMMPADVRESDNLMSKKEQELRDNSSKRREFIENQPVYVQLASEKTWVPAVIVKRHGSSPVYDIKCGDRLVKKHADVIKSRINPLIELDKEIGPSLSEQRSSSEIMSSEERKASLRPRSGDRATNLNEPLTLRAEPSSTDRSVRAQPSCSESVIAERPTMSSTVRRSARLASKPVVKYGP